MKFKITVLFHLICMTSFLMSQSSHAQRPPQFVCLAFDGSKSLSFWKESLDFAKEQTHLGTPIQFTYFISGVYFIKSQWKSHYDAPQNGKGKSAIGFSEDSTENLLARVQYLNRAIQESHEIASHANGHFDGSAWSEDDWKSEFSQFNDLVFNVFENNKIKFESPNKTLALQFSEKNVTGFRAPQLGVSSGLWPTLRQFDFAYDTSLTSQKDYWPEKKNSVWNFPLASLTIAGTAKRTLSMDYNFYMAHSKAQPDPKNAALYEQQMLDTYLHYFEENYNGNRAPLHIGHHFSKWNDGAYWKAMKKFAQKVCGLPEVKCVTYQELAEYMEQNGKPNLLNNKLPPPKFYEPPLTSIQFEKTFQNSYDTISSFVTESPEQLKLQLQTTPPLTLPQGLHFEWKINDVVIGNEITIAKKNVNQYLNARAQDRNFYISVHVQKEGIEIIRKTYAITLYNDGIARFSLESAIEDQALQGDLPEAHE